MRSAGRLPRHQFWSGWPDLNRRPLRPEQGALTHKGLVHGRLRRSQTLGRLPRPCLSAPDRRPPLPFRSQNRAPPQSAAYWSPSWRSAAAATRFPACAPASGTGQDRPWPGMTVTGGDPRPLANSGEGHGGSGRNEPAGLDREILLGLTRGEPARHSRFAPRRIGGRHWAKSAGITLSDREARGERAPTRPSGRQPDRWLSRRRRDRTGYSAPGTSAGRRRRLSAQIVMAGFAYACPAMGWCVAWIPIRHPAEWVYRRMRRLRPGA